MHKFKRYYLLGAVVLSLTIPLFTIIEYIEPRPIVVSDVKDVIPVTDELITDPTESSINYLSLVLWSIYGIGVLVFLIKFIRNLTQLVLRIRRHTKISFAGCINVLLLQPIAPHTFFKYIFLNKQKFENSEIPSEIMLHERTHAKQLHSIDLCVIEILQIIFWFNPLIYFLKQHIKLNHEFLADAEVLKRGVQPSHYQNLLLNFSSPQNEPQLATIIDYSSTHLNDLVSKSSFGQVKKRFTVMKTQTSKLRNWISTLLLIPVIAVLFYGFSDKQVIQKESNNTSNLAQNLSTLESNATEREIYHYTEQTFKVKSENGTFISKKFKDLSDHYKKKWLYVLPTPFHKKEITSDVIDALKDTEKYVVMIDGNVINNSKLDAYSASDFVTFSNSKISELAELKQQQYYNLITEEGLEIHTNLALFNYENTLLKFRTLQKETPLDSTQLKDTYAYLKLCFDRFTPELIDDKQLVLPSAPFQKMALNDDIGLFINNKGELLYNNKVIAIEDLGTIYTLENDMNISLTTSLSINKDVLDPVRKDIQNYLRTQGLKKYSVCISAELEQNQEGATAEQVSSYNTWAKNINTAVTKAKAKNSSRPYPIIKKKEVDSYRHIYYDLMTEEQRKNAEPWPNFPPPPPPHPDLVKSAFVTLNDQLLYAVTIGQLTKYYNNKGFQVSKAGKIISNGQVNASDVIPGKYITKVYAGNKVFAEFKDNDPSRKNDVVDLPPPPPPPPAPEKSKSKTQKYQKSEEVVQVNGKKPVDDQIALTGKDAFNFKLSLTNAKVLNFKLKVPGHPTRTITGNTLDTEGKALLRKLSKNGAFQIFDIKDTKGFVHPPIVVSIIK